MPSKNLEWLLELPQGWSELYTALIATLEELRPNIHVEQAKQKFGELRVYVDRGSDDIYQLIDAASRQSRVTCEVCGAEGQLRNMNGFYATRCDAHAEGHAAATYKPIAASIRIVDGKALIIDR